WDTRGNGRTVARFNYGHYVASESVATATANNPVNTRINNASRRWTDSNGNLLPDCDLGNSALNGECGALSAPLGQLNIVTRWDPDVLNGWNVRPNDNEFLLGLQQQVTERLTLDAQWTYHRFGNFFATQYRATPPQGYDSYCVTAPTDARLPNGGGNQSITGGPFTLVNGPLHFSGTSAQAIPKNAVRRLPAAAPQAPAVWRHPPGRPGRARIREEAESARPAGLDARHAQMPMRLPGSRG